MSGSETGERSKESPSGAFHHPSGFALQTGGPKGRQAVETGSAEAVDEVEQDRQNDEPSAPTEVGEVEFAIGEDEELFNTGFTPAADTEPQPALDTEPPEREAPLDLGSGNPSEPSSPSREPSPPPFAFHSGQQPAKGERPSVRLELGEIRDALLARQKGGPQIPMPKTPTKIKRDGMVM